MADFSFGEPVEPALLAVRKVVEGTFKRNGETLPEIEDNADVEDVVDNAHEKWTGVF